MLFLSSVDEKMSGQVNRVSYNSHGIKRFLSGMDSEVPL